MNLVTNPVVRYVREATEELRKVSWPTPNDIRIYTILVFAICAAIAVYFGALDWVLSQGVNWIAQRA